jgi:hypothetical protein
MKQGLINQEQTAQADPKVQEEADIFVANGIRIIHDQKVSDGLINQIKSNKDPIVAIADATLSVVERLEQSSSQKGATLSDAAKIHGANQLMGEIINLAEIAGVPKLNDDQKYQAFSLAISKYLDGAVKSGKMPKEQLAQMGKEASGTPEGQKIAQGLNNPQSMMPAQGGGVVPQNQEMMGR